MFVDNGILLKLMSQQLQCLKAPPIDLVQSTLTSLWLWFLERDYLQRWQAVMMHYLPAEQIADMWTK